MPFSALVNKAENGSVQIAAQIAAETQSNQGCMAKELEKLEEQ